MHSQTELAADVVAALEWQAERTAEQVNMYREEVIQRLEATGEELWRSGQCKAWLEQLHPDIRAVAKNVNGPLLLALCKYVGHPDVECVELFRKGALAHANCDCGLKCLCWL